MRTYYAIQLRRFDVRIQDNRTGEITEDQITFTKHQLQAAQTVDQSSKELIHRTYARRGFQVLDIGKAAKCEAQLDLEGLFLEVADE